MTEEIIHELTLPDTLAGIRLDKALSQVLTDYSRGQIQEWLRSGELLIDGKTAKPTLKTHGGEFILLKATLKPQTNWEAEAIDLDILYEDDEIIVINKPAGLVVHPAAGNHSGTLVNALLHHCEGLNEVPRAGLIHRIDKDTTGCLLIAKTLKAHTFLTAEMQKRHIKRSYLALVQGALISGGTIDAPIGRDPRNRTKMAIVNEARPAVTHYRIKERFKDLTLLDVTLETGRTHQIRVHLKSINYPIIGDQTYHRLQFPKKASEELKTALKGFKRQALHAKQLDFTHPLGRALSFTAPLPADFKALLDTVKSK
jgi:23S rRNA pseudouridine1911/1915/1917 synthase